jgi:hypothetical protein
VALGATVIPSLSYWQMFDATQSSDAEDVLNSKEAQRMDDTDSFKNFMARELHFNWWRFVEYSASGSLVLITIALLAGIVDVELLVCMFVLAATCMLLGIVAEFALRARNVLVKVVEHTKRLTRLKELKRDPRPEAQQHPLYILSPVLDNICDKLSVCFWMSHILGWACIILPWGVILAHYAAWWSTCDAETLAVPGSSAASSSSDAGSNRKPPDFVLVSFCGGCIYFWKNDCSNL